jgi:hypothetical protein
MGNGLDAMGIGNPRSRQKYSNSVFINICDTGLVYLQTLSTNFDPSSQPNRKRRDPDLVFPSHEKDRSKMNSENQSQFRKGKAQPSDKPVSINFMGSDFDQFENL